MLHVLAPPEARTVPVTVAASDLPAGHLLTRTDTTVRQWPAGALPAGLRREPQGSRLASPLRSGEPITDARLAGVGLLTGQDQDMLAVPVRLEDQASAELVKPGDRVDVLAGDSPDTPVPSDRATLLAGNALVLMTGGAGAPLGEESSRHGSVLSGLPERTAQTDRSGMIVLAVDEEKATRLAVAVGVRPVSIALRAGP